MDAYEPTTVTIPSVSDSSELLNGEDMALTQYLEKASPLYSRSHEVPAQLRGDFRTHWLNDDQEKCFGHKQLRKSRQLIAA